LDLTGFFGILELVIGAAMAVLGGWQYILGAPLPGVLGRPLRTGQTLEGYPPGRWQVSGACQALFGLGFLMFGIALLLQDQLGKGALDAIRGLGLLAWVIAFGLLALLMTRYRRTT
jgi:hypothetical protein